MIRLGIPPLSSIYRGEYNQIVIQHFQGVGEWLPSSSALNEWNLILLILAGNRINIGDHQ